MVPEYTTEDMKNSLIMMVDDEQINLKLLGAMLEASGYHRLVAIQDPREVLASYQAQKPDLILLDLNMPYLDGYDVMDQLRELTDPLLPPIVVLTAQQGKEFLLRALRSGARDYLSKPLDMAELMARVGSMLEIRWTHRQLFEQKNNLEQKVQERTAELMQTRLQVVQRLGRASEYRDNETGKHIIRVSRTAALIAKSLGQSESACEMLIHATPMHDVGKIGIPDAILLKKGKLGPAEWEVMKTHTTIGAMILEGDSSDLLLLAKEIALSHHERWDGTGYPRALAGEGIPLAGRIVALADVFDALTSSRPYKEAWTVEKALDKIRSAAGSQFDPKLVEIFLDQLKAILSIRDSLRDEE
jgi:putative two-component system response regulator